MAGSNKSVQVQIIDANGNYKAWDITSQLGTSLTTININPQSTGTVYNISGTFQLSQIKSIKFLVTTNGGGTSYVDGSLWVTDIKAY